MGCELVSVDGTVGAKVQYQNEEKTFSYTQLTAMLLTKLKEITEKELGTAMSDVVISIPAYYTESQRRALIEAAEVAGLNTLRLMHDVSAAALQWGITKVDLPESEPKYVAFVDIGQSDMSVAIVGFVKRKMMVKSIVYDRHFGGRQFDQVLLDHFVEEFKQKYKMDISTNPKALFRLRTACEKVKKVLSANMQSPINVECLMNDKDVSGMIDRASFEDYTAELRGRIDAVLQKALDVAGVTKKDIDSVEIVGGTTRIPSVKQKISDFFGKDISTTLNQDECVAKGCAFMCAILSPTLKTKEFKVEDVLPYPIKFSYDTASSGEAKEMIAFSSYTTIPCTKLFTFYRKDAFDIEAMYSDPEMLPKGAKHWLGKVTVKDVKPDSEGEPSVVKIKVKLNADGLLEFNGAQIHEERIVEVEPEKPTEGKPAEKKEAADGNSMETDEGVDVGDKAQASDENKTPAPAEKKTKKVVKKIDVPVNVGNLSSTNDKVLKLKELENSMAASDKLIFDTEDRKNALEEYVYEMRGKLEGDLADYVLPDVKDKFMSELSAMEDWLYGDGEDETKSAYVQRLDGLKKVGDVIVRRFREAEERPFAIEQLRKAIRDVTEQASSTDAKYEHIDSKEKKSLLDICQQKIEWLNDQLKKQDVLKKHEDPVVLVDTLKNEKQALLSKASSIMNKPKPKPKQEKKPEPKPDEKASKEEVMEVDEAAPKPDDAPSQEATEKSETMDVD